MVSVSLGVATLSPVRAASSISSVAVTNRRPSAGTRLPASISTMSPGTSCSASISMAWPSRRTRAMFFIIFSSAARLASALDSPRMPSTALKTVSTTSMIDVRTSRVTTRLMTAAPSRMICMKSLYWRRKACSPVSFFLAASTLGPYCCRRCCASAALNPLAGSTFSCCATASGASAYHFVCSVVGVGIGSAMVRHSLAFNISQESGGMDSRAPRSRPSTAAWAASPSRAAPLRRGPGSGGGRCS